MSYSFSVSIDVITLFPNTAVLLEGGKKLEHKVHPRDHN
jgi:hypothetical protein